MHKDTGFIDVTDTAKVWISPTEKRNAVVTPSTAHVQPAQAARNERTLTAAAKTVTPKPSSAQKRQPPSQAGNGHAVVKVDAAKDRKRKLDTTAASEGEKANKDSSANNSTMKKKKEKEKKKKEEEEEAEAETETQSEKGTRGGGDHSNPTRATTTTTAANRAAATAREAPAATSAPTNGIEKSMTLEELMNVAKSGGVDSSTADMIGSLFASVQKAKARDGAETIPKPTVRNVESASHHGLDRSKISEMKKGDLRKLAREHGVVIRGSKAEILQNLANAGIIPKNH